MDIMEKEWLEREALNQEVILLHDIARRLEQNLGPGSITEDLREIADRIANLIKPS